VKSKLTGRRAEFIWHWCWWIQP